VKILALGDRDPGFITHRELDAAFELMPAEVECSWTGTDTPAAHDLESADGVWLLPGTPYRDDEAAYAAIEYCRRSGTPFLLTTRSSWRPRSSPRSAAADPARCTR
jgi:hypothetical protein